MYIVGMFSPGPYGVVVGTVGASWELRENQVHHTYSRDNLANFLSQAVLRATVGFREDNPEEMVPAVAKMLATPGVFFVERNEIENLVDILNEALGYHENGLPS